MRFKILRTFFVSFNHYSSNLLGCHSSRVRLIPRLLAVPRTIKMDCGANMCCGLSKDELKERLTPQQYQVTQERDTERAYTGKYCNHKEKGTYTCIVCGQNIFSSEHKYESKCGWPAFSDVVDDSRVKLTPDLSHVSCNLLLLTLKTDIVRTEVSCAKCGSHMGHVFDDGPLPKGKRYCINSASLDFRKDEELTNNAA